MIYTLTLNPAIDYYINIQDFKENALNLAVNNVIKSGGKGINVSKMLNNLNIQSTALGVIGGFSGEIINKDLKDFDILNSFVKIKDSTRINIKLHNLSNKSETEITGISSHILKEEQEQLLDIIKRKITKEDILVCSGSIPSSLSKDFYKQIASMLHKETKIVLDTRGNSLLLNLCNNFLIKPNIAELSECLNKDLSSIEDIILAAKTFLNDGVENVIISMGENGSLLLTKKNIFQALPLKVNIRNTTGAGDSLVAGFLAGYAKSLDVLECFKLGVAASVATVASKNLGSLDLINNYLPQIKIKTIQ